MNCLAAGPLLTAYVDGELDVVHVIEVENHLAACDICARVVAQQKGLRAAMQSSSLSYELPRGLENRIARRLEPKTRVSWALNWTWIAAAAAVIAGVFALRELPRAPSPGDVIAHEIFDSHLRSLQPGHLTDVESTDRHTVKPWFNGKLDFSPPVFDLAADGFPLAGGRLDSIGGRPVAALVYMRARHVISLYLWPDNEALSGTKQVDRGYNIVQWNDRGFDWWAISDLNAQELDQFAGLLKNAARAER